MLGLRTWRLALMICAALAVPAKAENQPVRSWIDFQHNVSPVARPLDAFYLTSGGTLTSPDRQWKVEIRDDKDLGRSGWWIVSLKVPKTKSDGWAALRTPLPYGFWGKISGVRLRLRATAEGKVKVTAITGGERFYTATQLGAREIAVGPGARDIDVTWRSMGVTDDSKVTAFGIEHTSGDLGIGFSRIDVLFSDDQLAKEYDAHAVELQAAMGEWLAARGVNLNPQIGKFSADDWERRAWQGAQLIAMGEEIDHWRSLVAKLGHEDAAGPSLDTRRLKLIGRLENGQVIDGDLGACQGDVDRYVDKWMRDIPVSARKWYVGTDKRFHKPDCSPYRMFGSAYFAMLVDPNTFPDGAYKPWDIRYMSALGFNGMRLFVTWSRLEPTRGKFDPVYLKMVKDICREAERYGIAMSVDLHWEFPAWFQRGEPGMELPDDKLNEYGNFQNCYQWPEALIDTWGRLARELADVPNIAAWEVPANEPIIACGPSGAKAYPSILRSWNDYLRRQYGTREKLNSVWSAAAKFSDRYSLAADEDWSKGTIAPLGFQGDPNVDTAYDYSPRLWDHVKWHADMQRDLTGRIMKAIRKQWPGAVGIMQRSIGDMWDRSPVPLSYYVIDTVRGDFVNPGTHYGMGKTPEALRAVTQTYANYDTETALLDAAAVVKEHVNLGLGFCEWMYSARGEGGPLLADDEGHLAPGAVYLTRMANWIRTYWPTPQTKGPKVAIVLNGRMEAVMRSRLGALVKLLEARGCRIGMFNGPEIVQKHSLLRGYDLVITNSSYMDVDLLRVLDEDYKGVVLFHGRLDHDAYARKPENGLAAELVRRKILLGKAEVEQLSSVSHDVIDLTGEWLFKHYGVLSEPGSNPPPADAPSGYLPIKVPSYWDASGIMPYMTVKNVLGDGWYYRQVTIPSDWKSKSVHLLLGAIDDYDWTFVNGHLIGQTDESVPGAYAVDRRYSIPTEFVNWNAPNVIAIRVRNPFGDGGIWRGPVALSCQDTGTVKWAPGVIAPPQQAQVALGDTASWISDVMLNPGAEKLAEVSTDDTTAAAMVRQGRWFWWFSDAPWSMSPDDSTALDEVLRALGATKTR